MEIFKNLEIEGGPNSLKKCMNIIEKSIGNGWVRDKKKEKDYFGGIGKSDSPKELFCIKCPRSDKYPISTIWLFRDEDYIKIGNIIPSEEGRRDLSRKEYNHILDDFYNKFVKNAVDFTGVSIVKKGGELELEKLIGHSVAKALTMFSDCANKSTGSHYPCDERRWLEFLILAHLNDSNISTTYLREWLEGNKWYNRVASDLVCEYEFARGLLRKYDMRKKRG